MHTRCRGQGSRHDELCDQNSWSRGNAAYKSGQCLAVQQISATWNGNSAMVLSLVKELHVHARCRRVITHSFASEAQLPCLARRCAGSRFQRPAISNRGETQARSSHMSSSLKGLSHFPTKGKA